MTTRTMLTPASNAVSNLRNELDRLFDRVATPSLGAMLPHPHFLDSMRANPAINVIERDDTVIVEAEMPGVSAKDLEVSITDRILTIEGTRNVELIDNAETIRRERSAVRFERSFRLPEGVGDETIEASLENGILAIELPKSDLCRTHRVAITQR
ncbi:MAG: Hsp20/alpha crystallin family protein [Phycisphaerales bacterium]|nr:Hsp20/alpha crystallin family protein [Phycisphaerales bacterium]